jgi:hypothetical protein
VDVLQEVVDAQRLAEAGRAERGEHVVRTGEVVPHRRRRPLTAEHRAGVLHERQERVGIGGEQLEVLGGDAVRHLDGLLRTVDEHRVAALVQGRLDLGATRRCLDDPGDLGGDELGVRLVPRDQPGQAVRTVLGLEDDVDGGELGADRAVGHDHDLGRTGEARRHADDAGHLALGERHVGVARADDHVDGADGLGAVGERGDRLRTADGVHLVDARDGSGGQDLVGQRAVLAGRHREDDLGHAGDLRRDRRHQHRRRVEGTPARGVAPSPIDGAGELAHEDAVTFVDGVVIGDLGLVIRPDVAGGHLERGSQVGRDPVQRALGRHPRRGQVAAVEAQRELSHGGVAPGADGGQDRLHRLQRLVAAGGRARELDRRASAQIEPVEHRSRLGAVCRVDRAHMAAGPELSSINTQLATLVERLSGLAEGLSGSQREDAANALYEVERLLESAQRRLEQVVDSLI